MHRMTDLNKPTVTAELITELSRRDRDDLCDATDAAIEFDGGFGWIEKPSRYILERYWQGVLAVPQRHLFVGRVDGTIAGTAQIVRNAPNNQAQSLTVDLTTFFVAPWARGQGLGQLLLSTAEAAAKEKDLCAISLNVRETQFGAIELFKKNNYHHFGTNPYYAFVRGKPIPGHYFCKQINDWPAASPLASLSASPGETA
jgi:ribosomal protein S18 acetylase RimI-like enzyme